MLLYRSNPDTSQLLYPVMYSAKLDGIRCPFVPGMGPVSRTLKTPPNKHLGAVLGPHWGLLAGLDTEVVVGPPNATDVFSRTDTFWKSHEPKDDFEICVFDDFTIPSSGFEHRHRTAVRRVADIQSRGLGFRISIVPHLWARNEEELIEGERQYLEEGYEGIIIRIPSGQYKYNRTTLREMNAFKLKRFIDSEAVIAGFVEKLHNANELIRNDLGYVKRQTLQENMVPAGTLGAIIVRDIQANDASHKFHGCQFNIGTGFDDEQRQFIWDNRERFLGSPVTYKYLPHGAKDAPRHPVFKAHRDPSEISP